MADRHDDEARRPNRARRAEDEDAKADAQAHGLVTDEGVDEDRTGAAGPTLEEGAPQAGEPVGKRHPVHPTVKSPGHKR